ncbi:MAG: glycosyltransferase family 4 protein [Anaerolineaceae bacterium]|nr:glycosyltransferase family 4 protein [Anaerolineaceae bacterium]
MKVLILGNSHLVVFGFRGELIEELVKRGYEVTVSFPNSEFGSGEETSKLYGCRFVETKMDRRKTNPIKDLRLLWQYIYLIKKEKPDIVLGFTVKCDTYGGIACQICNVPFIPNITGIGKGLDEGGIVSRILTILYKIGIKNSKIVFFQNEHDREFFIKKGISLQNTQVLPGSGVNLKKFHPLEFPKCPPVVFLYSSRVMKAKGIEQYMEAARYIHKKYPQTEFHVCGICEEDYKDVIYQECKNGTLIYHGFVHDVKEYVQSSCCIVLPTFHPEGISNVLLEAAACARPIITTDRPGCRETVEDGISGYLIQERNSCDLIEKIEKFLSLTTIQMKRMGLEGRKKIEKEFSRQAVVDAYLYEMTK